MLRNKLPKVRGKYYFNFDLKKLSHFGIGGKCDMFFIPNDIEDLQKFLLEKPENLPVIVLGNMTNTLILDKGIRGCVINLQNLNNIKFYQNLVEIECGVNLNQFIKLAVSKGISCCEKLYSIPGTIGGALAMNAGVPEFEISNVLESISFINENSELITNNNIKMDYRCGNIEGIAVSCVLRTKTEEISNLQNILKNTFQNRIKTQPIFDKTCGSTFKNPHGLKAWELIKEAGCLDFKVGGASLSPLHCNFIINNGNAKAIDVLNLIDKIKNKVLDNSGILLEEEIKILGEM